MRAHRSRACLKTSVISLARTMATRRLRPPEFRQANARRIMNHIAKPGNSMRPPRKKASPKSGSTLDGDGLRAALAALCAKDDGVGVKELLIDQGVVVANEISHSRYAIESAYEADAVECF